MKVSIVHNKLGLSENQFTFSCGYGVGLSAVGSLVITGGRWAYNDILISLYLIKDKQIDHGWVFSNKALGELKVIKI